MIGLTQEQPGQQPQVRSMSQDVRILWLCFVGVYVVVKRNVGLVGVLAGAQHDRPHTGAAGAAATGEQHGTGRMCSLAYFLLMRAYLSSRTWAAWSCVRMRCVPHVHESSLRSLRTARCRQLARPRLLGHCAPGAAGWAVPGAAVGAVEQPNLFHLCSMLYKLIWCRVCC
jgi:hypothetical protein